MSRPAITFLTGSKVIWGAELSLLSLAKNFPNPPSLVTSNPALAKAWHEQVCPLVELVKAPNGRLSRNTGFVRALVGAAKRSDVLVIFDFYLLPLVMLFMPVLRANQVRIVVDVHDSKRTNPRRRIYFVMMRACHLAIAISDFILDQLERGPKARVRIYRPVSTPFEATRNLERDPAVRSVPRVGLVGQISPDKNLKQALEAIAASGHPVEVVMRGGTTEENRVYHSEVAKLGEALFRDAFVDEGRVQHARAMADIDILVLTNENEPFGRVAAEAQLAGVIVVGPSEGGIGEVLEDGRTGFSFEKDDVGGLVRAIGRAVVEVRTPTDIAVRAQRAARRRFDPVTQSRKYYDALQHA